MLILIFQSLHFKNPSLYSHTHWKEFCFTMPGRASSGMRPNEEAITLVFLWMVRSGWCGEGWRFGKLANSALASFPSFSTKMYYSYWSLGETRNWKSEAGVGIWWSNMWLSQNQEQIFAEHFCSHLVLHTHRVSTRWGADGWTVLLVWHICMCPCMCASTVNHETHTEEKNKKTFITLPLSPLAGIRPREEYRSKSLATIQFSTLPAQ